jgi:hypothetical protein
MKKDKSLKKVRMKPSRFSSNGGVRGVFDDFSQVFDEKLVSYKIFSKIYICYLRGR